MGKAPKQNLATSSNKMAPTKKMFNKGQAGGSNPGLVDTSNLGLDLGSTVGDTTTPEMTIGGMAQVPVEDVAITITEPDLTALDLKGGTSKRTLGNLDESIDVEDTDETERSKDATDDKDDKKKKYNVVKVVGSVMPSKNAMYVGTTPSMALNKAARRIHKKKPATLEFSVLMRRVSTTHSDRELYMYDVTMVKAPKAQGFITLTVDKFDDTKAGQQTDTIKKVRIVQTSEHPVFGYINSSGNGIADSNAIDETFKLIRSPGTNTLYLVVPGALPFTVNGITVVRTEWNVTSTRNTDISEELRKEFDTAGHARDRANDVLQHKKEREVKKRDTERARARAVKEKEHAAAVKARARERASAKKERDAQAKLDKKLKEKAKKQAKESKHATSSK